jgi:anti-sigma B factor antagonist
MQPDQERRRSTTSAAASASEVLRVSALGDDDQTVVLAGEFDMHGAAAFAQAVAGLLHDGRTVVAVDATRVSFMDSAGLKCLLEARRDVTTAGGDFRLTAASDPVRRVIALAGLEDMLLPA